MALRTPSVIFLRTSWRVFKSIIDQRRAAGEPDIQVFDAGIQVDSSWTNCLIFPGARAAALEWWETGWLGSNLLGRACLAWQVGVGVWRHHLLAGGGPHGPGVGLDGREARIAAFWGSVGDLHGWRFCDTLAREAADIRDLAAKPRWNWSWGAVDRFFHLT